MTVFRGACAHGQEPLDCATGLITLYSIKPVLHAELNGSYIARDLSSHYATFRAFNGLFCGTRGDTKMITREQSRIMARNRTFQPQLVPKDWEPNSNRSAREKIPATVLIPTAT